MSVGKRTRTGNLSGPRRPTGGGPVSVPGKRALTDGMAPRSNGLTALSATKPKGDTYLRDLIKATPGIPDQVAVTTTVEFASFVDPDLVWKWKLRVSGDEAVLACVLILDAMRAGASINWHMEALGYLNQARSELGKPTQPEAEARPEDLVSLPDGGVSELEQSEEGPAEEGPQVSELEEPEVLPGTPDKPPTMKHTDPGIPGLVRWWTRPRNSPVISTARRPRRLLRHEAPPVGR